MSKKLLSLLFVLIVFVPMNSCDTLLTVDCTNCSLDEPGSGNLIIRFSEIDQYDSVFCLLYENEVEKGDLLEKFRITYDDSDTINAILEPSDNEGEIFVSTNVYYSVKVIYYQDEKVFNVINGTTLETRLVTDYCDKSCYVIDNETIDARLEDFYNK